MKLQKNFDALMCTASARSHEDLTLLLYYFFSADHICLCTPLGCIRVHTEHYAPHWGAYGVHTEHYAPHWGAYGYVQIAFEFLKKVVLSSMNRNKNNSVFHKQQHKVLSVVLTITLFLQMQRVNMDWFPENYDPSSILTEEICSSITNYYAQKARAKEIFHASLKNLYLDREADFLR